MSQCVSSSQNPSTHPLKMGNLFETIEKAKDIGSSSSLTSPSTTSTSVTHDCMSKNLTRSFLIKDILNIKSSVRQRSALKPDETLVSVESGNFEILNKKLPPIPILEDGIKKLDGTMYLRKRFVCCYPGCGKISLR
ncbi:hypothetical protein MXB_2551, partial [Myxobolus squamalis]